MPTSSDQSHSPGKPPIPLAEVDPHEALLYSIGVYVEQFGIAEVMLSKMAADLLETDVKTVQFLWRDAGFRTKTKAMHRAARESFGVNDERFKLINGVLNRLEDRSNYRNDLLHGMLTTGFSGTKLGRGGNSFRKLFANFAHVTYLQVLEEASDVAILVGQLGCLMASNFRSISVTRSSSSSRGKK